MVTYKQWNKAIISYFFEDRDPGEKVFLHTTSETLPHIAEHAGFTKYEGFSAKDAKKSLVETVRKEVIKKTILPTDEIWIRRISPAEKEPPHVAFLALCVLAASNMGATEDVFSTNYFVQLNLLLFDKTIDGIPKGLIRKEWEKHWKYLRDWVIDNHNVELHLTQGHPKYVWYPISQCLISKYDENKLHAIFKEAELKPGSYLAEKQLLDILSSKKSFQNLSVKITRPIKDNKTAEIRLILGQIQLLLKNWDGEVWERIRSDTARQSSTSISIHLFDIPDEIDEICFWFRRRQSSQITFKHNSLNVETLQTFDEKWYESHVMRAKPDSLQILQNGTELKTTGANPFTYRVKPSDIWVFRWDDDHAVAWLCRDNLLLHEEHLIVYYEQLEWEVKSFLEQVCDNIPMPKPICMGGKETGWQYIKAKPNSFSDSSLSGFRITTNDQIEFVGGLPLGGQRNSYIDFCLPTIVVPNLIADSNEPFYMNKQPIDIPPNRKIELPDKRDSNQYQLSYLDCNQPTLHIITPKRSTEDKYKVLTTVLSKNRDTVPTYSKETISDITEKSGVWLTGAKLIGTDTPETTWDDVVEVPIKLAPTKNENKMPAQLISSVVKLAIELKNNVSSIPEGFDETMQYLEENVAMQALVQKKLQQYKETALSYVDLCKRGDE